MEMDIRIDSIRKTIYILIGPQGSGKTHWALNVLLAHNNKIVRISQDEQGKHHHRLFEECLKSGASLVIDRMNFDLCQRDKFVKPAMSAGYYVIFVLFDITRDVCLLRLAIRKDHPTIAINADHNRILDTYFDQFEPPKYYEYDEMFTIGEKGRCKMLDLEYHCEKQRVIVVGDIHGHFEEFMCLLDKCEYRTGDIVIATGDIVDRGPKIKETVSWFRKYPDAYTVEGNHDNKFRRYLIGNPVRILNGLDRTIQQCGDLDHIEWAAWLQFLPQIIHVGEVNNKPTYIVHAGVDGDKPIEQQHSETCLYARYLRGSDFYDDKKGVPWWDTLDNTYNVISGHIVCEDAHPVESAYCLDGGVCQGGKLRAMVIDSDGGYYITEVDNHG